MKSRSILCRILSLLLLIGVTSMLLTGCSGAKESSGNVVYEDMKTAFGQSGLLSANIGIFSKTVKEDSIS